MKESITFWFAPDGMHISTQNETRKAEEWVIEYETLRKMAAFDNEKLEEVRQESLVKSQLRTTLTREQQ